MHFPSINEFRDLHRDLHSVIRDVRKNIHQDLLTNLSQPTKRGVDAVLYVRNDHKVS